MKYHYDIAIHPSIPQAYRVYNVHTGHVTDECVNYEKAKELVLSRTVTDNVMADLLGLCEVEK